MEIAEELGRDKSIRNLAYTLADHDQELLRYRGVVDLARRAGIEDELKFAAIRHIALEIGWGGPCKDTLQKMAKHFGLSDEQMLEAVRLGIRYLEQDGYPLQAEKYRKDFGLG